MFLGSSAESPTAGGYRSPCVAAGARLLYQNIATLHFTYFPLFHHIPRPLISLPTCATHIFQKQEPLPAPSLGSSSKVGLCSITSDFLTRALSGRTHPADVARTQTAVRCNVPHS